MRRQKKVYRKIAPLIICIFFVRFIVFYIKEFTTQKKVTNKLFISVWRVVITRRARCVQSSKWDSVGCVSMWWFMYIEGYIFVF